MQRKKSRSQGIRCLIHHKDARAYEAEAYVEPLGTAKRLESVPLQQHGGKEWCGGEEQTV